MESSVDRHLDNILACYPGDRSNAVVSQFVHRLSICKAWEIPADSHVLDIGCGQGECSLVLAATLGSKARVTGVDTAPPDYGGPYTLGQSQQYILASSLGPRITFKRDEVESVLRSSVANSQSSQGNGDGNSASAPEHEPPPFDVAVLCHSLWYFDSPAAIRRVFAALLAARVPRIYLAEWKGQATTVAQEPHCLAVRAQSLLHTLKPRGRPLRVMEPNVRAALPAQRILQLAVQEGWRVSRSGTLTSPKEMLDGHWEAHYVSSDTFKQAVRGEQLSAESTEALEMYIDMARQTTEIVERSSFRTVSSMDVVWAVLEISE